jgi:hypothetical protein
MRRQIVHRDDVAAFECWNKTLFHVSKDTLARSWHPQGRHQRIFRDEPASAATKLQRALRRPAKFHVDLNRQSVIGMSSTFQIAVAEWTHSSSS